MANSLGDLVVRIVGDNAEFDKSVDTSQKKLENFAKKAGEVGKKLTTFVTLPLLGAAAGFLKLADTQAKAEASLTNAIRATGKEAQISVKELSAYASALQNVTTFGDEAQLSALALVQQLADLNQDGLKAVLPRLLDFSTAMGVDLQTAASLVGKTLGSTTNALSRYGIEIDATADPTTKLTQLTAALEDKFGGAAEAAAKAGLGPFQQLKNTAGDVGETFGRIMLPAVNDIIGSLRSLVTRVDSLTDSQKKTIVQVALFAAAIGPAILAIKALTTAIAFMAANPVVAAISAIALLTVGLLALIEKKRQARIATEELTDAVEDEAEQIYLTNQQREIAVRTQLLETRAKLETAKAALEVGGVLATEAAAYKLLTDRIEGINTQLTDLHDLMNPPAGEGGILGPSDLQKRADEAYAAIANGLATVQEKQEVAIRLGQEYDAEAENRKVVLDEINALVEDGFDFESGAVQYIITQYQALFEIESDIAELRALTRDEELAIAAEKREAIEEELIGEAMVLDAMRAGADYAEVAADKEKQLHDEKMARIRAEVTAYISGAVEITQALQGLYQAQTDKRIAQLDRELAASIAAGADEVAAKEKYEAAKAKIEYEGALKGWKLMVAQAVGGIALAIINAMQTQPFVPAGLLAAGIASIKGLLELATLKAAKPVPLAGGGIIAPTPGGTTVQAAEAGQPEVYFPLDQLDRFLSERPAAGVDGGDMRLVVNLDSRPILDTIFPATRNGTVLVDARAVV